MKDHSILPRPEQRLLLNYLQELRRRLLFLALIFLVFFALFFSFAKDLFHSLMLPLINALSDKNSLIAIQVASPVIVPIKLAADLALLCTMPFALWQLWRYAAPALYPIERHHLASAICGSLILFITGLLFCFYIVLPFIFHFFIQSLPKDIHLMPDIAYALDFISRMLLIFGLCFQLPLLCWSLVRLNLVEPAFLKEIRPYFIVAAFIIGMLLTPPDVLSQIMLAVPLCLLYELGIFLSQHCQPKISELPLKMTENVQAKGVEDLNTDEEAPQ